MKTNTKYNFDKAENEMFSWTEWDGTSGNTLMHKPSGRTIYQGHWLGTDGKMAESISEEIGLAVIEFRRELNELKNRKPERYTVGAGPEPQHGQNGYCRKCHSYCYGDCEAN